MYAYFRRPKEISVSMLVIGRCPPLKLSEQEGGAGKREKIQGQRGGIINALEEERTSYF